ncbi:hypothetical protein GCM10027089_54760 [Nocardia thraciensis]
MDKAPLPNYRPARFADLDDFAAIGSEVIRPGQCGSRYDPIALRTALSHTERDRSRPSQRIGARAQLGDDAVDLGEPRAGEQRLLVGGPFAPGGQDGVCALCGGLRDQPAAQGRRAARGMVGVRIGEYQLGGAPPDAGRVGAQGLRIRRLRQVAPQHPIDREFAHDEIGRDPGQVEQQRLDAEAAPLRLPQLALHHLEIAVVHVHRPPLDPQPGAPVEHSAAPRADLGNLTVPADRAQMPRIEIAAIVDRQIPVAVGPRGPLRPRPAERHRRDRGQRRQPIRHPVQKAVVVHGTIVARGAPVTRRRHGCAGRVVSAKIER